MKQLIHLSLILVLCVISLSGISQNVGIGINTPLARLHVTDSNVVFSAAYTDGTLPFHLPFSGAGSRLMWMPTIGAFRAGTVSSNYWNRDSIGLYSFAAGIDARATGKAATALGQDTRAGADFSTAIGFQSTAIGQFSISMGQSSRSYGNSAVSFGYNTTASGNYSTSMGGFTTASIDYSTALGYFTTASGYSSTAMGNYTIASGDNSTSMGKNSLASGNYSTAMGFGTTASGGFSTAMGFSSVASANAATAMGYTTTASGLYSTAMGAGTIAKSYSSFALGTYNDTIAGSNPTAFVATDPLVTFGNGNNGARTNAMVIYKNGSTDITGFTRLGRTADAAPAIKMKTITATGPAVDGTIAITHGLDATKILSVAVFMEYGLGPAETIPPFYTISPGFEFQYQIRTSDIFISNKNSNSYNLGSRPVKLLITYTY